MHVCTKSFLKTTTNSSCVCTHLANKADSDSDSMHYINTAFENSWNSGRINAKVISQKLKREINVSIYCWNNVRPDLDMRWHEQQHETMSSVKNMFVNLWGYWPFYRVIKFSHSVQFYLFSLLTTYFQSFTFQFQRLSVFLTVFINPGSLEIRVSTYISATA